MKFLWESEVDWRGYSGKFAFSGKIEIDYDRFIAGEQPDVRLLAAPQNGRTFLRAGARSRDKPTGLPPQADHSLLVHQAVHLPVQLLIR
jgi:hypothetical protein